MLAIQEGQNSCRVLPYQTVICGSVKASLCPSHRRHCCWFSEAPPCSTPAGEKVEAQTDVLIARALVGWGHLLDKPCRKQKNISLIASHLHKLPKKIFCLPPPVFAQKRPKMCHNFLRQNDFPPNRWFPSALPLYGDAFFSLLVHRFFCLRVFASLRK